MKVGDLVKVKEGAALLMSAYRGHIGIILDYTVASGIEYQVMINGEGANFLSQYLEVISESG